MSEDQFVEMTFFIMPGLSDGFEDSCLDMGGISILSCLILLSYESQRQ